MKYIRVGTEDGPMFVDYIHLSGSVALSVGFTSEKSQANRYDSDSLAAVQAFCKQSEWYFNAKFVD